MPLSGGAVNVGEDTSQVVSMRCSRLFHGMFVYWSGHRRVQGIINPGRPKKISKPKYEAAVLHEHLSIGYPNSSTGSMHITRSPL
jgi:hypothetical protein